MEEVKRNPLPQIPVVDLSQCNEEMVAIAVVKASEEFGIFQIVNHGIPMELVRRLQEAGRQFFELPETEKKIVGTPLNFKNRQGYAKKFQEDQEGRKAFVDHLLHYLWPPSFVDYSYWPKNPPNYRGLNEDYAGHVEKLSEKILRWLSEGLGLKKEALKEGLGGDTMEYMIKINYYPPCPHEMDLAMGLNAHTDINILTLLVTSEVPGLQVFKDDHWLQVNYIPFAVIVIIGDQIMRLSNGRYKNVLHRAVLDKERTRMSWATRMKPNHDMLVGSLPELTTGDDNTPKFKPLTYRDYKYRSLNNLPLN